MHSSATAAGYNHSASPSLPPFLRPVEFIHSAVENAKPLVETIKWKSGGRAIQMPVPCRPARAESLALRLLRCVGWEGGVRWEGVCVLGGGGPTGRAVE